jgi:hypothetical protein
MEECARWSVAKESGDPDRDRSVTFPLYTGAAVSSDHSPIVVDWPDPTTEMLADPRFEAVWQVIKTWDINVPSAYGGYCGATGNHVRAILDAIAKIIDPAPVPEQGDTAPSDMKGQQAVEPDPVSSGGGITAGSGAGGGA